MSAEDLINSANSKVADYAGNASSAANAAVAKALSVATTDILLPSTYPLNWSTKINPGTVTLTPSPTMISEYYETPDKIGDAPDILAIMEAAYQTASVDGKAAVDAAIYAFLNAYCPGYAATLTTLQAALVDGLNNSPLSDQQQAQLFTKLHNQLDDDRKAAQRKALQGSANGHETPLFQYARLDQIDADYTDNLAQSRASLAATIIQISVEFKKYCMGLMNEFTNSTRSAVLQYAGLVAQLLDFNVRYAIAAGDGSAKGFDAEVRGNSALIQWATTKLDYSIKRMTADIDRYKADLEAKIEAKKLEYLGADIEIKQKQIGFEGELKTLLEEAQLNFEAAKLGVQALDQMAVMWGRVAESAASGVNAIASQSVQE